MWRALNLWDFVRSPGMQVLVLLVTAAFVVLEARYNLDLLGTIADPGATREAVQSVSDRGKVLTALGISWVLGRFLLEWVRPTILGLALLGGLGWGVYSGLDHVYATVIRDLPTDVKLKGFSLFNYRYDLLTGKLSDPDIVLPKDDPVIGRLMMGAFPIVVLDQRFMLPANDIVERKANDAVRFVLKDAEKSWPDYARNMQELQKGWREFKSGSEQAVAYKASGGLEEFRRKSGGLEANPSLTLEQFVDMLRDSRHPKGLALRDAEARQVGRRPDGTPVTAREVPKFMGRQQYFDWFAAQAKEARDKALPTEKTIETMSGIQEINSAVFLPPMAMLASLTSALTNALTFVLLAGSAIASRVGPPPVHRAGQVLQRYATPFMLALLLVTLLAMPRHVFPEGPLRGLETKMHARVGVAGMLWSRLSNIQVLLLRARG